MCLTTCLITNKKTSRRKCKGYKKLLGGTKAKMLLLYQRLLKCYLKNGFVVTNVYQLLECRSSAQKERKQTKIK